jgi:hypothetical protein
LRRFATTRSAWGGAGCTSPSWTTTFDQPQTSGELGAAAGSLVSATTGFSLSLFKAAVSGLDAVARVVNTAVTESNTPPRP